MVYINKPVTYSQSWTFFEGDWHEGNVPIMGPRTHAAWLGSARANCISLASDCRRSCTLGLARSPAEAAAIMVNKRFARGSSGIAVPSRQPGTVIRQP